MNPILVKYGIEEPKKKISFPSPFNLGVKLGQKIGKAVAPKIIESSREPIKEITKALPTSPLETALLPTLGPIGVETFKKFRKTLPEEQKRLLRKMEWAPVAPHFTIFRGIQEAAVPLIQGEGLEAAYETVIGKRPERGFAEFLPQDFREQHPYLTMATQLITDVGGAISLVTLSRMPAQRLSVSRIVNAINEDIKKNPKYGDFLTSSTKPGVPLETAHRAFLRKVSEEVGKANLPKRALWLNKTAGKAGFARIGKKKPTKALIVTDKAQIQEIKNSIAEGESILKSGKTIAGRKMSVSELDMVRRSVENAKAKIGEGKKLPPHLQKLVDKQEGFAIEDVTPKGFGPEPPPTKPSEPTFGKFKPPVEPPPPIAPPIKPPTLEPGAPLPPAGDPVQKVMQALKEAKPVRGKQERLYTQERGKRLARSLAVGERLKGERGFFAEKAQLRGELPRAQFESIRAKITQGDIDNLFIKVKDSPLLNEWNKINARGGLAKLFGEYGGKVPTESELKLLNKVFGPEFIKTIKDKRDLLVKLKEIGYQLWNMPKSVMASLDFSAPFRQGAFFIGRPKQFWPAFGRMFKPYFSEKAFTALQEEIIRRPTAELMDRSRLSLTGLDETLSTREEAFMSSWAEKIPIVGPMIVRASGRAYVGFLNKLRADVFDDLVKKAGNLGLDPKNNIDLTKAIAGFINTATGRGFLGSLERIAVGLNSIFFSPRLMASRLSLLNPAYYMTLPPFVRKEALKSLLSFASVGLTILGLAKLNGAKVGTDPRSSDFGKIKIGNTRIDIWGGFQPYVRMAAQLLTGEYVSSTTGKIYTLGEGYKPLTRYGILLRQVEGKFSPALSFIVGLLKGQTFTGEPVSATKELGMRFVPMTIQDLYDVMKDDPSLAPAVGLAVFGVGVQTYAPRGKKNPILEKYGIGVKKGKNPILEKYGIK